MIVADTSALVAILQGEAEAEAFQLAIEQQDRVLVGAATAFEFHLVVHRKGGIEGRTLADVILSTPPIEIVPWTPDLVAVATDALRRFGGRPASLNYGDCMAYALAKSLGVPLLYKGNDFASTDIRSAL